MTKEEFATVVRSLGVKSDAFIDWLWEGRPKSQVHLIDSVPNELMAKAIEHRKESLLDLEKRYINEYGI